MIIPHEKLNPEALQALIEEFVTRDGTDSGYTKGSLEGNVAMVKSTQRVSNRSVTCGRAEIKVLYKCENTY